jgi:hypothetical protein
MRFESAENLPLRNAGLPSMLRCSISRAVMPWTAMRLPDNAHNDSYLGNSQGNSVSEA